ncbi:WhiB family transcriptional regulator [Streptomyces cinereoruber]|uniref:WhiB family transcriptional regulator n=1 Tax=Streptomyces cinereoruber TaxID=67260 RepID=UPI0036272002
MHPCEVDPAVWFSGRAEDVDAAKEACGYCPVRVECAELGVDEEFGIWGGMTPDEIRKARHFKAILLEEQVNAQIRRMHADRVPVAAMARQLGIPRKTLTDRIRRLEKSVA